MKKALAALLLAAISISALAQNPYDVTVRQRRADDLGYIDRFFPLPADGASAFLIINGATMLPQYATLGAGLALNSGVISVTVASQVNADWNATTGVAKIDNKPSISTAGMTGQYNDLAGIPTTFTPAAHNQAWSTITSTPTTRAGYGITDALGAADIAGKFNTPTGTTAQYVRGDGSLATLPVPSQSSASRTLNSGFQVSSTRPALVFYSVQITVTATIASGQDGQVVLEVASDSGFTTNLQTLMTAPCSQVYSLAVALQGIQKCPLTVSGFVPAGYYARLRTANTTGTPAYAYLSGQEVLL